MNEDDKKTRIDRMAEGIARDTAAFIETLNDKDTMTSILDEVRADQTRKNACKRHRFVGGSVKAYGDKYACIECNGLFSLTDIGQYMRGYLAAGGSADDIWPGWNGRGVSRNDL